MPKLQSKKINFLFKFWPIIFIIAVWLVFSSPYFFLHKVPYPAKYQVTFFSPWSYYLELAGPVKNNAMPDVIDQIYPWKYFTIQSLKSGQLPFWNPYNFAGNPHIANFQSAVFSPFNLIFFILPFIDAWSLLILLQPLLAGLFMYLFIREIRISKTGAVISSIAFMFCGFIVVWMAYGSLSMAIAFLPLILFSVERYFRQKNIWILSIVSFGIASSYFSGHIQTSIYLTAISAVYILYKLLWTIDIRRFLFVLIFFILGLSISLIQIIPTLDLLNQSVRSNLVFKGGQIPLNYLVTVFAPDFYGNPVTRNDWIGSYAEWASFIGIIPLVLSIFALLFAKKSYIYFLGGIGILALLFASDTFLRQLLAYSNLPVLATSIPSRLIVIFSFSFAALSGIGFDAVLKLIEDKAKKKILITLGVISLLLAILWLEVLIFHFLPVDKVVLAKKNLIMPTGIFLLSILSIISLLFYKNKKTIMIFGVAIMLLVSFDSIRFATKWMPFDERKLVYSDIPVVKEIQKRIGNGRVFGNLGTQVEAYYGIPSLIGYDPLYIKRYGEFIRTSIDGNFYEAERSVVQVASRGKYTDRVLDLLGVTIVFNPKADIFQEWAFPVWADKGKYSLVYEDDKFQLFKNNTALPRVKLFYQYQVIKDGKAQLRKFYTDDFDFRNVLLLEENPGLCRDQVGTNSYKCNQESKSLSKAEIIFYSPNKVVVSVETGSQALLFLSDSFYDKWKAIVNGKEAKIYRADYSFRAVKVPQGKSTVEFYYRGLF
ncbi:YfhO family protein [Candidatus Roizmanbacteria bacterium]|nr:YfhO family protein [Candidatus Roizmanbacteria bacterium]